MSLGYAEKLSFREDLGGQLGAPELFDSPDVVESKVEKLAALVREARRIVAFTGAGISTSCSIPDFRGPNGVWTCQRAGKPLPRPKVTFSLAKPSPTHQALRALMDSGKLTYLVSQNVDGLHLRSGIPRQKLAELHGNCFAERCPKCNTEYIRDFEVETVGFKHTGRSCSMPCNAKLRDFVLDWEDALPVAELEASEQHARQADLAICLGTSLQITPACNIPLKTTRTYKDKSAAGKLVIINLQATQHDKKAEASGGLVIRARTDEVMQMLFAKLCMPIPLYAREDAVHIGHTLHATKKVAGVDVTVFVQSTHGAKCGMPMLSSVEIQFEDSHVGSASLETAPFSLRRSAMQPGHYVAHITLKLHEAADADKREVQTTYEFDVPDSLNLRSASGSVTSRNNKGKRCVLVMTSTQRFTFISQTVDFATSPVGSVVAGDEDASEGGNKRPRLA